MAEITAQSTPDLDDWGWDEYWSCPEWMQWFYALKKEYGREKATQIWGEWWNKQTSLSHAVDCRSFNSDFKKFVKDEELSGIVYEGIFGLAGKTVSVGADVVSGAGDVVSGATEGASNIAKQLKWIIPSVLVLATVGLVIYGYKTFAK